MRLPLRRIQSWSEYCNRRYEITEVLLIVALAAMLLGLLGVFLPLLPGVPLLFAGMLLAGWLDDFARVGVPTLAVLAIMALAA